MGTRRNPSGLSAWRNMAHRISSRAPVHSVLVQKSVTTSTNLAGRLFKSDARKLGRDAQEAKQKKLAGILLSKRTESFYRRGRRDRREIPGQNRDKELLCVLGDLCG